MKQITFSQTAADVLRALREDEDAGPMLLAVKDGKCAWVETTAGYDSDGTYTSCDDAQWWLSVGAGGGAHCETFKQFARWMANAPGITWRWFDSASDAVHYIVAMGLKVSSTGFPA